MNSKKLLVLFLFIFSLSCKNADQLIVGKWKGDKYETDITNISPQVIEDSKKAFLATEFELKKNGKGIYTESGFSFEIKWEYINDTLKLLGEGNAINSWYKINSISKDQFISKIVLKDHGNQMLYFKKIK